VFEWDREKAAANLLKHGVSFEQALTVFADATAIDGPDIKHSKAEQRRFLVGRAADGQILGVTYTLRSGTHGEAVRIITALRASRKERRAYQAAAAD